MKLIDKTTFYLDGQKTSVDKLFEQGFSEAEIENAYQGTIAYSILRDHNTTGVTQKKNPIKIKFDCICSHDITYVGIIQTAKASGLKKFPIPYVLTNCHNSLCAVGGTINEDDHVFGLSAAKKYGGIYVPPHLAVIHTYMREAMSGCGKMILGSDSHTRYGALGTMACGEGGPELVKQLLSRTYDIIYPDVVAVELKGKPRKGVGPQDVALSIIGAVFANGFVKNKVMEFIGEGISSLPIEFRNGIDVMTTETACLSSIWTTDEEVKKYYETHLRAQDYRELKPRRLASYDSVIEVDLSQIRPQIAMPFHPSNVYALHDVIENPQDILAECEKKANALIESSGVKVDLLGKVNKGKIQVDQGVIAGCAGGTFDNIVSAANIVKDKSIGNGVFGMSVYPSSQPVYLDLIRTGSIETLMKAGAVVKTAFCGPCFGAGDVPSNNALSIRHTTRNFESREGSKPSGGQIASVALMDARSIAATCLNGGILTSAEDIDYDETIPEFRYDDTVYQNRVYNGLSKEELSAPLTYGPNIRDWPEVPQLKDNLLVKFAAVIRDPVTTTDELIPSGETSSYRSNPLKLAEFALSRKVPEYVARAKEIAAAEKEREEGKVEGEWKKMLEMLGVQKENVLFGSAIYATKPGDGSAREQAASCQRVLGGAVNVAREYATKRYRSNLINWGMLPLLNDNFDFLDGDFLYLENVRSAVSDDSDISAKVIREGKILPVTLRLGALTSDEKEIILSGCLINYYRQNKSGRGNK